MSPAKIRDYEIIFLTIKDRFKGTLYCYWNQTKFNFEMSFWMFIKAVITGPARLIWALSINTARTVKLLNGTQNVWASDLSDRKI
jgi:hypothetical protein